MPRLLASLRAEIAAYPRAFWVLWVGTLVNRLGLVVLPFLTLYLTAEQGLRPSVAAALLSGYGLGAFASNFAGGALADRWGRKPTLLLGLFGGAALIAAVPFVSATAALAGLVVVLGFVSESYRPAVSAAIVDLVAEERRARAFALFYWVINVGTAVAPVLAGFLAARSYGLLFALDATTMAVYGVILLAALPETRPVAGGVPGPAPAGRAAVVVRPARFLDALRDPVLVGLSLCTLLLATLVIQAFTVLPLVMQAQGMSETDYGLVVGVNGVVIVLLSLPIARFVERRPPYAVLVAAALLFGTGFGMHAAAASPLGYAAGVAVWTLGEIALVTVAPVLVARRSPTALRGAYQGVYGSAWSLAFVVAPLACGAVFEAFGAAVLWAACAALGLAAALGFAAMGQARRRPTGAGAGSG